MEVVEMAAAQITTTNSTRGINTKITAYGKEIWAQAQAKVSKFKVHTTMKSMDGGNHKMFPISFKREFTKKDGGVQATPYTQKKFSRRALRTASFHAALAIDPDDLVDNQVSITDATRTEDAKEAARVCDRVILSAHTDTVEEGTAAAALPEGHLSSATTNQIRFKANAWAKASGDAGDLPALTADDLEDINFIFGERDVEDQLVATLTPEFARILRKDADFKNRENAYARDRAGEDGRRSIRYKEIDFVYCSKSVMPILGTSNIAVTDATTREQEVDIVVRDLGGKGLANPKAGAAAGLVNTVAKLKAATDEDGTALGGQAAVATAKSKDVVYFWSPRALYFSTRDDLNFMEYTDLPRYSHAKSLYQRINLGAMLIDDNYALTVVLKGKLKSKLA